MSMVALQAVRSTLPRALHLPVIVPTVERVERMLSGTARYPSASLGLGELDAALPPGTARVTPAGRRAVLDERMRQATRLQRA